MQLSKCKTCGKTFWLDTEGPDTGKCWRCGAKAESKDMQANLPHLELMINSLTAFELAQGSFSMGFWADMTDFLGERGVVNWSQITHLIEKLKEFQEFSRSVANQLAEVQ